MFPPREPIGLANGIYSNACCGVLELHDGQMSLGNTRHITYVVEYDKVGRYVLPESYVGVSGHVVFVGSGYPMKLRLDKVPHPQRLDLIDSTSGDMISFNRATSG